MLCVRDGLEGEELDAARRFVKFLSDNSLDWAEGGQSPPPTRSGTAAAPPPPPTTPPPPLSLPRTGGRASPRPDIKPGGGREGLLRLAPRHDVVLDGFRPGVLDRQGFTWERIREINPRIVYASSASRSSIVGRRGMPRQAPSSISTSRTRPVILAETVAMRLATT